MQLRDYQKAAVAETQRHIAEVPNADPLIVISTGGGKCLGAGTPVMKHDGSVVPVEKIQLGDSLMGPDGNPRTVMRLARGREMLYRVTPVKGDPYVVNESHVLSLKRTRRSASDPLAGAVVNIDVRSAVAMSKKWWHLHKGWRAAVDFPELTEPLRLEPYFLGVWLGDGTSRTAGITTGDPEIVEYVTDYAERMGCRVLQRENSKNSVYLNVAGVGWRNNAILSGLKELEVLQDKHVPHRYKTGSRAERMEVLAGLLDSDGYYMDKGYDVVLVNERLMDDLIFVARSLGFAAYKRPCKKTCCNTGAVGNYFRCFISGDVDAIPCRVARNKAKPRAQIKNVLVTGVALEAIGEGDYFGFELDGPDRLFLLGDFTVTHNTVCMGHIAASLQATHYQAAIAHRRELVSQIAMAFAKYGVPHRVIGPATTIADCRRAQLEELGRSLVDQNAKVGVCSVDTLIARDMSKDPWVKNVVVAHFDEAHHCTVGGSGKWEKAKLLFPNLRHSIGYTATPRRADRKPLRGFFSHIVEGPPMHELMAAGYLTPYKLVTGAVSDIDLTTVSVAASGDYNPQKLRGAMKKSRQIVGDAVAIYQRYCPTSKAVLFACDVEDAGRYREAFTAAGIPAEIVTAETREDVRRDVMKRFKTGALQVLVNVDLFGEGFDLPAIETVIMCRPTKSLPLYQQQFGRALRLMVDKALMKQWHLFTPEERRAHIAASAKPHAWIIDLVRNWAEPSCGGLPDARGRVWSLDGAERSGKGPSDVPLVRACTNPEPIDASGMLCTGVYERFLTACPQCGYAPVPAGRTIEQVDGDVTLVDEETLARLRGEYLEAHTTPSYGGPHSAALYARHRERHEALSAVRQAIEWWGPFYEAEQGRKLTDREQMKAFYLTFGVTTLEAVSLRRAEADGLRKKVLDWMELKGFTIPA